jgi:PAS domain S-box-containing protein
LSQKASQGQDLFKLLVESVIDYAIFALDANGYIASWNQGAERFKGYKAEEIIGKHFSVFYPEEDILAGKPDWELREAVAVGRVEDEGWRLRKDGSRFWANVVITALFDENRELRGFAKVTRDLTVRKENEDSIRDALDRERDAAEQLRRLDEMKNEFVAMVAHDLRSPMGVVTGFAETLMSRWENFTDEQRLDIVGRIRNSATRLSNLITDVLDVARIEAGELDYNFADVDLRALVLRTLNEDMKDEDRDRMVVRIPEDLPPARADAQRTWQVLLNLLSNAVKFSTPETPIEVTATSQNETVTLEVSDQGPGIPKELQTQIFERFRKIPGATGRGTGLGLYIARSIVEAQGGALEVTSKEGQGSTFSFTLPAAGH